MNLKEWAASQGISYATARRWHESGKLPVPAYQAGRLIVIGEPSPTAEPGITAVYARVSSPDQEPDLDRQVARITAWAAAAGLPVGRVVTEVGSALDGRRREFLALLRDASVKTIVVEHLDRVARCSAEYVEAALAAQGRRLLVVDPSEAEGDLAQGVAEMLTALCGRMHDRKEAADRVRRAVEVATGTTE